MQIVPQSPRFLILHGEVDKALSVLNLVARINCKPRLQGCLVTVEEKERMQRDGELANNDVQEQPANGGQEGKDDQPQTPSSTPLLSEKEKSKVGACMCVSMTCSQCKLNQMYVVLGVVGWMTVVSG